MTLTNITNNTILIPSRHIDVQDPIWLMVFNGILISLLLLTGLFMNITLIVLLLKKEHLRTPTNLLLGNLTISNVMACILLLFMLFNLRTTTLLRGAKLCEFTGFLQHLWWLSNVFTLTFSTYDRYKYITNAMFYKVIMTKQKAAIFISIIWILAVGIAISNLYFPPKHIAGNNRYTCGIDWSENITFSLVFTSITFWIPSIVMTYCYVVIYCIARRNSRVGPMPLRSSQSCMVQNKRRDSINGIVKKSFIVFGTFLIAWTPQLVVVYMASLSNIQISNFVQKIIHVWQFLPVAIYPYIFVFRDTTLRNQLRKLINDFLTSINTSIIYPAPTIDEKDYSENVSRRNSRTSLPDTSRSNSSSSLPDDSITHSNHGAIVGCRRESNDSGLTNVYI